MSEQTIKFVSVSQQIRFDLADARTTMTVECIGAPGVKGDNGDADGAFLITNRLSELNTTQAKIDARVNLELQQIDCGVFL